MAEVSVFKHYVLSNISFTVSLTNGFGADHDASGHNDAVCFVFFALISSV